MSDKLFIRTKDGRIYDLKSKEVSSWEYINKELANKVYKEKEAFYCIYYYDEDKAPYLEIDGKGGHSMDSVWESEILKQADTIEKLFDEFVGINKDGNVILQRVLAPSLKELKDSLKTELNGKIYKSKFDIIYGAVWCKWGLKYVAKMNPAGKFVLY